ncbi:MAG: SCO family protein [Sphingomonadales bacterium]
MAENQGPGTMKWLWIAVVALVVGVAAWLLTPTGTDNQRSESGALVGGPFSLVNQDGERVTNETYRGRYMLVYFGFTNCPDVCPIDLQSMTDALDLLRDTTLARIEPIFITVDPERDQVEEMREYVRQFHPRLQGLTGTREEIDSVAKAYRVFHQREQNDTDGDDHADHEGDHDTDQKTRDLHYLVDHSAIAFLMGPEGDYIAHFSTGFSPTAMANRLESVIAR